MHNISSTLDELGVKYETDKFFATLKDFECTSEDDYLYHAVIDKDGIFLVLHLK